MKTSVIVSTYNRQDMLVKVLDGLRHQTIPADEIIIADDGSNPKTVKAIHKIINDFPTAIHHIWQEDRGFRAALIRNKAIQKSSGDYLISLDGDCIPGKHFIEDHISLAENGYFFQGKRILVGQKRAQSFTYQDIASMSKLLKLAVSPHFSNKHHLLRLPFFPALSSKRLSGIKSCNLAFFRKDIYSINGFNQDFVGWGREDSELAVRLYKFGLKKKEHPFKAICFHLWHRENDRKQLSQNDKLLQEAIESDGYVCSNGLVQK